MKRDLDSYNEKGLKRLEAASAYDLPAEDVLNKAIEIYNSKIKVASLPDALYAVSCFFFHIGFEAGCRYENNKSK